MAEKIAIIIVNYKNWPDTIACLNSIPENNNFIKIVIDQESVKKETIKYQNKYKNIKIINSNKNLGFAAANNLGIKYALKNNIPYIFLLNNDTIIEKNTIQLLLAFMQKHPDCGICSPINYFYKTKKIAFSGGRINCFTGLTPHFHNLPKQDRRTQFITGASMFISSVIFKKTGLLSEDYFLYYEDSDFCEKVKKAGFPLQIVASARIQHKVSQSTSKNPFIYYYCQRNRLLFFSRYCPKIFWPIFILFFSKDLLILFLRGLLKPGRNNNFCNLSFSCWGILDFFRGYFGKNEKVNKKLCEIK